MPGAWPNLKGRIDVTDSSGTAGVVGLDPRMIEAIDVIATAAAEHVRVSMGGDLQAQVGEWHAQRFPKAKAGHVYLKAVSELGELGDALLGADVDREEEEPATGDVLGEAADVVMTMLALIGRFLPDADLLGAVWAKLGILTDPDGTHRSSIGMMLR
jgi:hypothetical protein